MENTLDSLKEISKTILSEFLSEYLKEHSIRTLDFANASTETTDYYINLEKGV